MSDLFDYVRICLFEHFPRNIELSSQYVEESELLLVFRTQFEKILSVFGIADQVPLEEYTIEIFEELYENELIEAFEDPLAGQYYWANLKNVGRYMQEQLGTSDIYKRKKMLADNKLYEAVFARVKAGEIDTALDADNASITTNKTLTVKAVLSESERAEFIAYIAPMRADIENAELEQTARADALAALDAIEKLSEAPNPLWQAIALILSSPMLSNITALAALAIAILKP